MKMKTLYALVVILIVLYIGINVSVNGLNILNFEDNGKMTIDALNPLSNGTTTSNGDFPNLENFTLTKISSSDAKYLDNATGVNIEVQKIDNSQNLSNTYNNLISQGTYTSSQEIDQNGVTAYFLYVERQSNYDTDIFFNKNGQNYKISGHDTIYENSDYFINACKHIIDTI